MYRTVGTGHINFDKYSPTIADFKLNFLLKTFAAITKNTNSEYDTIGPTVT